MKPIDGTSDNNNDYRKKNKTIFAHIFIVTSFWLERVTGVEPVSIAWEAIVLPLYYTRGYVS